MTMTLIFILNYVVSFWSSSELNVVSVEEERRWRDAIETLETGSNVAITIKVIMTRRRRSKPGQETGYLIYLYI